MPFIRSPAVTNRQRIQRLESDVFAKHLISVAALLGASIASAAPVNLGLAAEFSLVSFGDFNSRSNSIAGNVAVAGNMDAASFSLNGSQLVVGGNLDYRSGSIAGDAYVGGTRSTQSIGFRGQWLDGEAPLGFAGLAEDMQHLSAGLAAMAVTGNAQSQWGGLHLTGTQSSVEVFQLSAADLLSNGWSNLAGLTDGSTVIFNISGTDVRLTNGMLGSLGRYNALLNFYEAQTLTLNSVSLQASILAPQATVQGSSGNIGGNVVAGNWNASITLNGRNAFRGTDVAGYVPPSPPQSTPAAPALPDRPAAMPELPQTLPPALLPEPEFTLPTTPVTPDQPAQAEVPEPGQLSLRALALGAMLLVAHRRGRRRGRSI